MGLWFPCALATSSFQGGQGEEWDVVLARCILRLPGEVKGDLKKEGLLNKAGHEGFVGLYQAEVGEGEERELCSSQKDQHVQKLRGESAKYTWANV